MPDNTKEVVLQNIEDPHARDLAHIGYVLKDAAYILVRSGTVITGCYAACAALLEAGDHGLGILCFSGCTLYTGAMFVTGTNTFVQYTSFRKIWQQFSIPAKDFILSFFDYK